MSPARGGSRPSDSFTLDRRRFLLLAGGAAAYLALRPSESWAKKAAKPNPSLQPWVLPEEIPANPVDAARALIGAAVLAPSDWNAQPWRFEVEGNTIRLVADARRALPVTDPARRGMMIGLGASLENLLIAARSWLTVFQLPAYAPELNPVENVWEYMRKNWFGHQVWRSYKTIVDACCEAWNKFMQMPERIASVTQREWAAITVSG